LPGPPGKIAAEFEDLEIRTHMFGSNFVIEEGPQIRIESLSVMCLIYIPLFSIFWFLWF
jgi:hypothetical protein